MEIYDLACHLRRDIRQMICLKYQRKYGKHTEHHDCHTNVRDDQKPLIIVSYLIVISGANTPCNHRCNRKIDCHSRKDLEQCDRIADRIAAIAYVPKVDTRLSTNIFPS